MDRVETPVARNFQRIGQGFCGTVWAPLRGFESDRAIKREDGGPGRSLYNDFIMHRKVLESLSACHSRIRIPACHRYVCAEVTWWNERILRFPDDFQIPCNALVTERIPQFPRSVRDTIVELYYPESLKPSIKLSEPNQDCLIRPYLGRRRRSASSTPSRFQAFSLRNYPLHIDQIEELGLNSILYARLMAETLAIIYWRAHIDANDVEFVLAPFPIPSGAHSAHSATITSDILGTHAMWILDFDCCRHIAMDETGVEQAVAAFYRNDPYYLRPGRDNIKDQSHWNEFKDRSLGTSAATLGREDPEARLPALWVDMVEQRVST
ncbi:MAG: hypothetical protein Q9181_003672 [Wetmoreana brouardii]